MNKNFIIVKNYFSEINTLFGILTKQHYTKYSKVII